MESDSKEFLVWLFTDLRRDLADRTGAGGKGNPDPEEASRDLAIFEVLLAGLREGAFPDNEAVREYVAGLAKATDDGNEYEHAVREHRALAELSDALAKDG